MHSGTAVTEEASLFSICTRRSTDSQLSILIFLKNNLSLNAVLDVQSIEFTVGIGIDNQCVPPQVRRAHVLIHYVTVRRSIKTELDQYYHTEDRNAGQQRKLRDFTGKQQQRQGR